MIKEFDLDAPRVEKPKRIQFRDETRCITALFERCYVPSRETGKPWKILVEVMDQATNPKVNDLLGVLTTQVNCNVDEFLALDNDAKKKKTLKMLLLGVKQISMSLGFDLGPFESAAEEVEDRSYINEWTWGSSLLNPSKTMSAQILVSHEVEAATLSARIQIGNSNDTVTLPLVSDRPNEFIFDQYFGSFSWVSDNTIELLSRNGEKRFSASLA